MMYRYEWSSGGMAEVANGCWMHSDDVAAEIAKLKAENDALRERLRQQTSATLNAATYWHNAVARGLKDHGAIPDGIDVDGHPIDQVVGTCLAVLQGKLETLRRERDAANVDCQRIAQDLHDTEQDLEKASQKVEAIRGQARRWKALALSLFSVRTEEAAKAARDIAQLADTKLAEVTAQRDKWHADWQAAEMKLDDAKREVENYKACLEINNRCRAEEQREVVVLRQEAARLRACIAKYADHSVWFGSSDGRDVWCGGGYGWGLAEAALKGCGDLLTAEERRTVEECRERSAGLRLLAIIDRIAGKH